MKVLSGVYAHNSFDGDILFENEPCNFSSISDSEKRGIVIIHQELALSPYLSIAENIYLGNEQAKNGWVDWRKTNLEANKLLARVGLVKIRSPRSSTSASASSNWWKSPRPSPRR